MPGQNANNDDLGRRLTDLLIWADTASKVKTTSSEAIPCTQCSEWEAKLSMYDLIYNKFVLEVERKDMALAELINMIETYSKSCKCSCMCMTNLIRAYNNSSI